MGFAGVGLAADATETMDEDKIRKLIGRPSAEQIEHLRQLQVHAARDAGDFGADHAVLRSLEVYDLIFQRGSMVSLTYRGKMVARRL